LENKVFDIIDARCNLEEITSILLERAHLVWNNVNCV